MYTCTSSPPDKADGGRVSTEIDDASQKLQDLCECLGVEVNERINVLDMLKHTKAFSSHKFNEFKRTVQVCERRIHGVEQDLRYLLFPLFCKSGVFKHCTFHVPLLVCATSVCVYLLCSCDVC